MMALLSLGVAVILQAAAATPPPAVTTVEKGQDSVMEDARNVTVRSQAEWMKVWRMHNFEKPAPKVDFAKDMVVGVFMGSRPSAGFSVEIVGTRVEAGKLTVQYREDVPAKGTMSAQILTSPYHLVSVPRVDGDVKFEPVVK
jgi:hypothetical protein